MKKLLIILTASLFTLSVNAQGTQTEDEVYIGKGRTFGNYRTADSRPIDGQITITGMVIPGGVLTGDSMKGRSAFYAFKLRKDDGTVILVGTKDYGFTIPRTIEGHIISIQGIDASQVAGRKRRDIGFAAIGIMVID